MRIKPIWAAMLMGSLAWAPAQAADLWQAWQATTQHHPDVAAALAARQAGDARRLQADRLWRPSVGATLAAGAMGSQTSSQGAAFSMPATPVTTGVGFQTSVDSGPGTKWAVQARMPVYSPERSAQQRQLELAADLAQVQWTATEQQLMLQTAERYFAVVTARDQLRVIAHQRKAIDRALEEAKDRFRLGDSPITDTHEAQARAAALQAQELSAQVDVQVAEQALASATGWGLDALQDLSAPTDLSAPIASLQPLDYWLEQAAQHNPQVRQQSAAVELARQESAKAGALAGTTVDLVAQAGREHLSGSGNWGRASNSARQFMVGVQLQVPLYSGGQRDARLQELLGLEQKAQAELEGARLQTQQQTRATWMRLRTGEARERALLAAMDASRARLDATQLGRQVGDRTTLDLLMAQNDAAQAELAHLQHRSQWVLERLRLLSLAGQLDEASLRASTQP